MSRRDAARMPGYWRLTGAAIFAPTGRTLKRPLKQRALSFCPCGERRGQPHQAVQGRHLRLRVAPELRVPARKRQVSKGPFRAFEKIRCSSGTSAVPCWSRPSAYFREVPFPDVRVREGYQLKLSHLLIEGPKKTFAEFFQSRDSIRPLASNSRNDSISERERGSG